LNIQFYCDKNSRKSQNGQTSEGNLNKALKEHFSRENISLGEHK